MKFYFFLLLFLSSLYAQEDLSQLLEIYKQKSDLSNITKKESAGFLELFTRDDLEKMQAHTLTDVLKTLSSLHFVRTQNNTSLFFKPSMGIMPLTAVRLYINDHDMSSTTFGSAFLVWGEMSISYIDHIEVYKATSSIEFGNENATLIIKLYTKDAARENGGKVQLLVDDYGSFDTSIYHAQTFENSFSYFAYAQTDNIKREVYHNYYNNNKKYDFDSDKNGYNLYANLSYKKWQLELGNYKKRNDSFIGIGIHKTPDGGDLNARQSYLHLSKKFDNNIKFQISFDDIIYERSYFDENNILIYDGKAHKRATVQDYYIKFHDHIFSTILEKTFQTDNNKLLLGGFYKYKDFKSAGEFTNFLTNDEINDHYKNSLNLYSIYFEENYDFNKDTRFILSMKGDFYNYDKKISSQNEYILRTGLVKNINNFQVKLFYTDSYLMVAPYQLYNNNTPYITTPKLNYPKIKVLSASLRYKLQKHIFRFIVAKNKAKDMIIYHNGYKNKKDTNKYLRLEGRYNYDYDINNKLLLTLYYSKNSKDIVATPNFGTNLRIINAYNNFDIYNEFIYKNSYTSIYKPYLHINASLDWTASIKYHYNKDLSIGIRGENILNKSYKVAYRNLDEAIQVTDRKVWLNMEYAF